MTWGCDRKRGLRFEKSQRVEFLGPNGGWWSFSVRRRRLTFGVRRGLAVGVARDGGADGKVAIERLCLSLPYVEKPFNSKVIKSFVPEQRSRKCFSCFGILMLSMCVMDIMNVLRTGMNISISHIHVGLCYSSNTLHLPSLLSLLHHEILQSASCARAQNGIRECSYVLLDNPHLRIVLNDHCKDGTMHTRSTMLTFTWWPLTHTHKCCEQYWTRPGGSTPQSSICKATYHPSRKTIWIRQNRHAGHCWRSRFEFICDLLLWTPSHGRAKVGRPASTYI